MPLTPTDVANKQFRIAFRGYSLDEVDAFLDEVETELSRLLRDNAAHKERAGAPVTSTTEAAPATPAAAPLASMEGQEAALRTLLLAQRTADEAIAEARAEAEEIVAKARAEADSALSEANAKAARIDQDVAARIQAATGDLDARRRALEGRIEELRAFEREYRTRLQAYLETQLRELASGSGGEDGGAGVPAGARSAAVSGAPGAAPATPGPAAAQPGPGPGPVPVPGPGGPGPGGDDAPAPSGLRAVPPLAAGGTPVGPFTAVPSPDSSGDDGDR